MNQNETRTLWISVFAALFAVFLLYSYTQEKSAELTRDFGTKRTVVIAAKDINEMMTIDETMLEMVERPEKFIEPSVILNTEDAVGQVALAPIKKGEQVLNSKITKPGPITGLALQVAPTKRAVSIPIDEIRGVARLIKPGDRIDIIAAVDVAAGQRQRKEVKTLLQDVIVLATGERVANELPRMFEQVGDSFTIEPIRGNTNYSNLTIEVSPEEAQEIIYILATSPGSLYTTLRHPSDRTKTQKPTTNIDTILDRVPTSMLEKQVAPPLPPMPAAKPPAPKRKGPFKEL
jgi:pilus assembly protein CpaB